MPDNQKKRPAGTVVDIREYQRRRDRARREPAGEPRRRPAPPPGQRKKRRPRRRLRYARLYIIFGVILLLAVGVLVSMDVFCVRQIDVQGEYSMAQEDILAKAGLTVGENLLKVRAAGVRAGIETDPLLKYVSLKWNFPDKLVLTVQQRQPFAAISYLGTFIIIDEECRVLDTRSELPSGQYPMLSGVNVTGYEAGQVLEVEESAKRTLYCNLAQAVKMAGLSGELAEINLQDAGDITLLTREGIVAELGNGRQLEEKCAWIAAALPQLRTQGKTGGTLYATGGNGAVYSPSAVQTPQPTETPQPTPAPESSPSPTPGQQ